MIAVSKCLLGENCRYDGGHCKDEKIMAYLKDREFVAICPECLGGLPIPREPSEIIDGKVYSKSLKSVDEAFHLGAEKALQIIKEHGCRAAILKENSPSCGIHWVYDGTFSGKKIAGKGICTQLLEENGIRCFSSEEIE